MATMMLCYSISSQSLNAKCGDLCTEPGLSRALPQAVCRRRVVWTHTLQIGSRCGRGICGFTSCSGPPANISYIARHIVDALLSNAANGTRHESSIVVVIGVDVVVVVLVFVVAAVGGVVVVVVFWCCCLCLCLCRYVSVCRADYNNQYSTPTPSKRF
jgi:hypothetical protein